MTFDPTSVEVTCVTLPKDHCVQVPWKYINVCGYSDQFCKKLPHTYTYYIHTHTTYRISDHIVSFWTTFRRDKKMDQQRDRQMSFAIPMSNVLYPWSASTDSRIILLLSDRQTDRKTDRKTERQTDRPTDRQTDMQTDRQTDVMSLFTDLSLAIPMSNVLYPWSASTANSVVLLLSNICPGFSFSWGSHSCNKWFWGWKWVI